MSDEPSVANLRMFVYRIQKTFGKYIQGGPICTDYQTTSAGVRRTTRDWIADVFLGGANLHMSTDTMLFASFQGIYDYMPKIHFLMKGGFSERNFIPFQIEFATELDVKFPKPFVMNQHPFEGSELTIKPENHPLEHLLNADPRFSSFVRRIQLSQEVTRNVATLLNPLKLVIPSAPITQKLTETISFGSRKRIEVFQSKTCTFVGLQCLCEVEGSLECVGLQSTGVDYQRSINAWTYSLRPLSFEVFLRLAYYTNYLAFPFDSTDTSYRSQLQILNFIRKQEGVS